MKIQNAHLLKNKWNFFVGILIAFTVLFSTSSLASTIDPQMQMSASHVISSSQSSVHEVMPMGNHQDCCNDEEKSPCSDGNACKISCMNFSMSYAVLSASGSLIFIQGQASNIPDYIVRAGILASLNAPPPRA